MKKTLLFTATAFLTGILAVQAQNVSIPDPAFKNYLVGNSSINTNSDSEIQVSEASAFTGSIYVPNLLINDLTGIEAFTGVTNLNCFMNNITTLDLSNNTALYVLSCRWNSLTTLDLSNNLALVNVDCSHNQLTALDVSLQTNLTGLDCSENLLTSLNVANGNNSNMINLYFRANQNPPLTCIEVDSAAYSTSNWFNVDALASFSEDCSTIGITDIASANAIIVYPNPTTGALFLSNNCSFTLTDLTGKIILQQQNTNAADITSLPAGLYFILISDDKGQFVQRSKLIKE